MDILQIIVRYCNDNFQTMGTHILNHNRKNNSILNEYIFRSVSMYWCLIFLNKEKQGLDQTYMIIFTLFGLWSTKIPQEVSSFSVQLLFVIQFKCGTYWD